MSDSDLLWAPDSKVKERAHITNFINWLKEKKGLIFEDYQSLWSWSIDDTHLFWATLYEYFEIIDHGKFSEVTNGKPMPFTRWFEGSKINYAEHIFRNKTTDWPAVIYKNELSQEVYSISWAELESKVLGFQHFLIQNGVQKGDRVVAYLPNIPEATIAFLATISLGAIWSSCSPDFGSSSVIDRFQQIEPKIFITVDGYTYNGKRFDKTEEWKKIRSQLPTLVKTVLIPFIHVEIANIDVYDLVTWQNAFHDIGDEKLIFTSVEFNDPIWILYSSGTTGKPKAITHSQGGVLLEHLKYMAFHNDVHPGERFFWYSTTGWMMWNFVNASLLMGATIVLYEGSPTFPDLESLWKFADDTSIVHFGTSAPFIIACMKGGIDIKQKYKLINLKSIGSTGSPLPPDGFDYIYKHISEDVWLASMSGGTDVCTAFVGGNPILPVYEGEIQCRALGCSLYAFDDFGKVLDHGELGEMVITKPMPSMPVFFWNDENNNKYLSSYFEHFEGIWRHGDWIKITNHNGIVILGRSDATLNRHGVRIGTAEIYSSLNKIEEIKDSLIINLELEGGRHYMPLFVVLQNGQNLDIPLKSKINNQLKQDYSPRHVPDEIFEVEDLPYTISGKKLESPVKKILLGMEVDLVSNKDAIRNPDSLIFFKNFTY